MEKGATYYVVYSDGDKTQSKILIFDHQDGQFLFFINPAKNQEEGVHQDRIIRVERRSSV